MVVSRISAKKTPQVSHQLINFSRSPSPGSHLNSGPASHDGSSRPPEELELLETQSLIAARRRSDELWQRKKDGIQLFYTALCIFCVAGFQFGTLLINRFLFWTGTFKFPYPLTMTLIQLVATHILLVGFSMSTRLASPVLRQLSLGAIIAPAEPITIGPGGFRQASNPLTFLSRLPRWIPLWHGGITGYGLLDFRWKLVGHIAPVAIIYLFKIVFSNVSYAYPALPVYQCARIGVIPFSLLATAFFDNATHSVSTMSSSLTAVFNLLMASIASNQRKPWLAIAPGLLSSLLVALYPIFLLRTYRSLVTTFEAQIGSNEEETLFGNRPPHRPSPSTRAYYTLLHYISVLSITIWTPFVVLSREPYRIYHNCYFLDESWFWFLVGCASLGGFAVFASTLLLVLETSPLTATFVMVPRSAFQLTVLEKFRLGARSWVGVALCSLSCVWYAVTRSRESPFRAPGR